MRSGFRFFICIMSVLILCLGLAVSVSAEERTSILKVEDYKVAPDGTVTIGGGLDVGAGKTILAATYDTAGKLLEMAPIGRSEADGWTLSFKVLKPFDHMKVFITDLSSEEDFSVESVNSELMVLGEDTELGNDYEMPENVTLVVPEDVKLTVKKDNCLRVAGCIINNGEIDNKGELRIASDAVFNNRGTISGAENSDEFNSWYESRIIVEGGGKLINSEGSVIEDNVSAESFFDDESGELYVGEIVEEEGSEILQSDGEETVPSVFAAVRSEENFAKALAAGCFTQIDLYDFELTGTYVLPENLFVRVGGWGWGDRPEASANTFAIAEGAKITVSEGAVLEFWNDTVIAGTIENNGRLLFGSGEQDKDAVQKVAASGKIILGDFSWTEFRSNEYFAEPDMVQSHGLFEVSGTFEGNGRIENYDNLYRIDGDMFISSQDELDSAIAAYKAGSLDTLYIYSLPDGAFYDFTALDECSSDLSLGVIGWDVWGSFGDLLVNKDAEVVLSGIRGQFASCDSKLSVNGTFRLINDAELSWNREICTHEEPHRSVYTGTDGVIMIGDYDNRAALFVNGGISCDGDIYAYGELNFDWGYCCGEGHIYRQHGLDQILRDTVSYFGGSPSLPVSEIPDSELADFTSEFISQEFWDNIFFEFDGNGERVAREEEFIDYDMARAIVTLIEGGIIEEELEDPYMPLSDDLAKYVMGIIAEKFCKDAPSEAIEAAIDKLTPVCGSLFVCDIVEYPEYGFCEIVDSFERDLRDAFTAIMAESEKIQSDITEIVIRRVYDGSEAQYTDGTSYIGIEFTKPVTVYCDPSHLEDGDDWGGGIFFTSCVFDQGITVVPCEDARVRFSIDLTDSCTLGDGQKISGVMSPEVCVCNIYQVLLMNIGGLSVESSVPVRVEGSTGTVNINGYTFRFDGPGAARLESFCDSDHPEEFDWEHEDHSACEGEQRLDLFMEGNVVLLLDDLSPSDYSVTAEMDSAIEVSGSYTLTEEIFLNENTELRITGELILPDGTGNSFFFDDAGEMCAMVKDTSRIENRGFIAVDGNLVLGVGCELFNEGSVDVCGKIRLAGSGEPYFTGYWYVEEGQIWSIEGSWNDEWGDRYTDPDTGIEYIWTESYASGYINNCGSLSVSDGGIIEIEEAAGIDLSCRELWFDDVMEICGSKFYIFDGGKVINNGRVNAFCRYEYNEDTGLEEYIEDSNCVINVQSGGEYVGNPGSWMELNGTLYVQGSFDTCGMDVCERGSLTVEEGGVMNLMNNGIQTDDPAEMNTVNVFGKVIIDGKLILDESTMFRVDGTRTADGTDVVFETSPSAEIVNNGTIFFVNSELAVDGVLQGDFNDPVVINGLSGTGELHYSIAVASEEAFEKALVHPGYDEVVLYCSMRFAEDRTIDKALTIGEVNYYDFESPASVIVDGCTLTFDKVWLFVLGNVEFVNGGSIVIQGESEDDHGLWCLFDVEEFVNKEDDYDSVNGIYSTTYSAKL